MIIQPFQKVQLDIAKLLWIKPELNRIFQFNKDFRTEEKAHVDPLHDDLQAQVYLISTPYVPSWV